MVFNNNILIKLSSGPLFWEEFSFLLALAKLNYLRKTLILKISLKSLAFGLE